MKSPLTRLIPLASGALAAPALLLAQAASQPDNQAQATTQKTDEVVQMSAFDVSAGTDRGYVASESMSGSRVATQIKDLPYALNVVTSEFMKDFSFLEASDEFAYTSGVNNVDLSDGGSYNMRGFGSQYMLRDGFFRLGTTDPILIDRVEFIKGPNADIYGELQPGGMINIITKRPTEKATATMDLTAGSYSTDREDLIATGPVSSAGKTYYLLAASDYERDAVVDGSTLRNRSLGLGIEHKFNSGGDLYILSSYMRNQAHSTMAAIPYLYNPTTKTYSGLAYPLAYTNQNGPNSETTRDVYDSTATFTQTLNSIFSVRAAANWYHRHKWLFNAGNGTQYDYVDNLLTRGTPAKGLIGEDGAGLQADLLAQYNFLTPKVPSKTLVTFDFSDYYRFDPTWNLASAYQINNNATTVAPGPNGTYWFKNIIPGQPINYSVPAFNPNTYYSNITRYDKNRASIWGGLLRQQMNFFNDRLLVFGMIRYDDVIFNLHSYRSSSASSLVNGIVLNARNTAWSPAIGLNYKLTKTISAYLSRSNGFNANAQNQNAVNGDAPNERSWGYDYGFKFDLLQDRLFATIGGYYITRNNVADTELLANGTTIASFDGSQLSRGFDTDVTFRVNPNVTLLTGYGYNNTIYTYFGRDTGAIGFAPALVPHVNAYFAGKYAFTGALDGLSFNLGITYNGSEAAVAPNTGDTFNSAGVYTGNDGRRYLRLPSYSLVNLVAHYRFHLNHGWSDTISVSLPNLLNKFYVRNFASAAIPGDRSAVYVTNTIGF